MILEKLLIINLLRHSQVRHDLLLWHMLIYTCFLTLLGLHYCHSDYFED